MKQKQHINNHYKYLQTVDELNSKNISMYVILFYNTTLQAEK